MFLGKLTSFAVDAAMFGATGGGCAYFMVKIQLYGDLEQVSAREMPCVQVQLPQWQVRTDRATTG
jgi:hypothetical protein